MYEQKNLPNANKWNLLKNSSSLDQKLGKFQNVWVHDATSKCVMIFVLKPFPNIWNITFLQLSFKKKFESGNIFCSVFSVDYNDELDLLVSGSADFSVKVWALSAGACLNTLTGHTEWVTKVSSPYLVKVSCF